jgi:hypothetical protein
MPRKKWPAHMRKKRYQPKQRLDGTFKKPQVGKYKANGRRIDGKWFASGAEADRYEQLKVMAEGQAIERLRLQVPFAIQINGKHVCNYVADFTYYISTPHGLEHVVEDVKGFPTTEYRLKKKLVEAYHQIIIHELPGKALKHFEGLPAPACKPIIDRLEAEKKERARIRKEKRKLKAVQDQLEAAA